jgi:uncharacterized phage-associated protein
MTASDLAHIVTHYVNQRGDSVSPKKLQKLLYYVEAWHLVHFNKSIVEEDFEAWVHGPVLPSLYHELKPFGFNDLRVVAEEFDTPDEKVEDIIKSNGLSDDQLGLIYSVLDRYAGLTSMQLELLTHKETPWIEARGDCKPHEPCKNKISKPKMRDFYTSLNSRSHGEGQS